MFVACISFEGAGLCLPTTPSLESFGVGRSIRPASRTGDNGFPVSGLSNAERVSIWIAADQSGNLCADARASSKCFEMFPYAFGCPGCFQMAQDASRVLRYVHMAPAAFRSPHMLPERPTSSPLHYGPVYSSLAQTSLVFRFV